MIRKTSKRRGSSVIAALIVLGVVLGYGLTEWKPFPDTMEAVPASRPPAGQGRAPEKIVIPEKGEPVRLFTMNAGNYFVPEDPRRSNFQIKYKPVETREAVAELIRQSGAEMVGLSEMGGEAAVRDLQMRLKRKGVQLPHKVLVMRDGEDRGLAFLSKYPIVNNNSVVDMPVSGETKRKKTMLRGILDVTVKIPDGRLFRLVGVHLKSRLSRDGSAEDTRRREAYALRDYLNEVLASQDGMPVLLYGDFNDGPADSAVQVIQGPAKTEYRLNRLKPRDSRGETWTIYYEDGDTYHSFDHLFVNNTLKKRLGRKPPMGILDSPPSRQASDHRGVWVELK
ncbi:endonuclease/exonuclease/phosphatase family protein [uncultured Akkermansia sp.]|uniref:endonuclease/exonuclease/phosphatase family protein n=1 Tax=uncultured Akkermansia sp. TaxID=512294 RepID=UPI00265D3EF7|nr:endonuclease/exonuclease/phosphatase family protein [uncultured Akkermansia sp.]